MNVRSILESIDGIFRVNRLSINDFGDGKDLPQKRMVAASACTAGALAAKEMGGSLAVFSDGLRKGATFTLELPLDREQRQPMNKGTR